MLTLKEVLSWIKTLDTKFDNYYIGTLDAKKDRSLGIYDLKRESSPAISLGGLECTKYAVKKVSLLIHWNNASDETEEQAIRLFEELLGIQVQKIGEYDIYFVGLLTNGPVNVGRDDKGICEYVIELEIYYKR